jgi:hypothetical protein
LRFQDSSVERQISRRMRSRRRFHSHPRPLDRTKVTQVLHTCPFVLYHRGQREIRIVNSKTQKHEPGPLDSVQLTVNRRIWRSCAGVRLKGITRGDDLGFGSLVIPGDADSNSLKCDRRFPELREPSIIGRTRVNIPGTSSGQQGHRGFVESVKRDLIVLEIPRMDPSR